MQIKVLYVERKLHDNYSLERVFRQIADSLSKKTFDVSFQQVKYQSTFSGMIKNLFSYKPNRADVYHITGHITYIGLIMSRKNTILTIPDMRILMVRKGFRRFLIKKLFFDLPIRKLDYITAISQSTKDDVVKYTGCDHNKVRVLEVPLDRDFTTDYKEEFNSVRPRILQVGTAPHKNIPNVIKSLEGINCELVIIGKLDEATISLLKEKNINYLNEFDLDDEAVRQHYQKADITMFCSIFEGFGLPIIEAQAMKTPVVTSNINPMKEVAGNGAMIVDPYNHSEIRKAVRQIIDDKELRETLVKNGEENIKRYHHQFIAEKYENLYREVFEKNQI